MAVFSRGTEHHLSLRPHVYRDGQGASPAAGMGELSHALQLLRATSVHVSLFRFALPDHGCGHGLSVVTRAFGPRGIVGRLPGGDVALMLVNSGRDDRETEIRVADDLVAACRDFGLSGMVEVSAVHAWASDVSDLDELLFRLALRIPRRLPLELRRVAAA
jgi:hypothetical protein